MWQVVKSVVSLSALGVAALAPSISVAAEQVALAAPMSAPSPYMRVHRATLPPYGYLRFCAGFPSECVPAPLKDARIEATPSRLAELDLVNRHVNRTVEPATDQEIYGEMERWTLPGKRGDCEDYALLKRHLLMKRGWPASALLMTVVRDEKGEGHAVLTARTSKGDYILDNKADDMRRWHETPYAFVMRQSYINPNVWLSLELGDPRPAVPVAGTRDGQ
ncbi:MAG: transglutaminase-like cysteine peptidase [Hyphomicrobiaceae bacterium]|nr:transglutaminase-like cysteine peptidase [Hyphomicrobiaceae bacterium]